MFGFFFMTREQRLCQKYTKLMNRSYKLALTNKEKSDEFNAKAKAILDKLKELDYKGLDRCL